jgi:hypothetical protein
MLAWLKNLIAALLVFCASWLGAVWYWRANNRMPATDDLVMMLLVLPLVLLLIFWLGRKIYRGMSAAPAALAGGAVAGASSAAAATPGGAELAANTATLGIVASSLRAPHGMSGEELRGALAANSARPSLDPELYDDYGYPIMSARMPDDGADVTREDIAAWMHLQGMIDPQFSSEQWRALNAGSAVAAELASYLAAHPQLAEHAGRTDKRTPSPLPMLQLQPVWPVEWKPEQRQATGLWFQHLVVQAGWPEERIARNADRGAADTEVSGVLARLLAERAAQSDKAVLALVLACGSHLGSESVDRMSVDATLFTSSQQQGQIPGEGAAGLLLADPHQARLLAFDDAALPELKAVGSAQLPASADQAKRASSQLLCELSAKALQGAHCEASHVALIAADTDHRTNRVMELMGVVSEAMPQLDPATDVLSVGAGCGSCGAVTYLTALVLARQEAQDRNAAVLCISNLDPYRRDVAVIGPAAVPVSVPA